MMVSVYPATLASMSVPYHPAFILHPDITYESIAKAFNTKVVHHQETINRMYIMNQYRNWALTQTEEQKAAQHRMALFPETAEVIYVDPEIWVVSLYMS
jgi:hypothetical protein